MAKQLTGVVVSTHMQQAIVVEVMRKVPHPLYKKLLKRSKKFKVALHGQSVKIGDRVTIVEIKPVSKDIHFVLKEAEKK